MGGNFPVDVIAVGFQQFHFPPVFFFVFEFKIHVVGVFEGESVGGGGDARDVEYAVYWAVFHVYSQGEVVGIALFRIECVHDAGGSHDAQS